MNKVFISTFLLLSIVSCKHHQKMTKEEEAKVADASAKALERADSIAASLKNDAPGMDTYNLVVSFISIGGGTDGVTNSTFKDFFSPYQADGRINVDKVSWGREGETDYCIRFLSLKKAEQDEFLSKAKSILSKSELVQFKENVPCSRKRN